jgi:gliding motility-associated-like protein
MINVIATPDTLCYDDGTGTTFNISTPNPTTGTWVYDLVTTPSDAGVTGYNPGGTDQTTMTFTDLLINHTDNAQTVTYHFTPKILDPTTGVAYCQDGMDTTIVIKINPQPKINIIASADTICNDNGIGTSFTVSTPNNTYTGIWVYDLVSTPSDPVNVSGYTPSGSDLTVMSFTDILVNNTDIPQTVSYKFSAKFLNPSGKFEYCEDGMDTTVVIWINPTPKVEISPESQEFCNNGTTQIRLSTPTILTEGVVTFDFTSVPSGNPGDITGFSNASGLTDGSVIGDLLVNHTDTLQSVTYYITPRALPVACADGPVDSVRVVVHPTSITRIDILRNVSCNGYEDGILEVIMAKGVAPLDVTWHDGPGWGSSERKDAIIDSLTSGTYSVTVVDNLGCVANDHEFINEPSPVPLLVIADFKQFPNHISCAGGSDGLIIVGSGGAGPYPPYNYWVTNENTDTIQTGSYFASWDSVAGLSKGTYYVTVKDNEGCKRMISRELKEPAPISFEMVSVLKTPPYHISCNGYSDGQIELTNIIGGNGDYTYMWSSSDGSGLGPLDDMNQDNLAAGTYRVVVTDKLGCTGTDSLELIEPDGIELMDTTISDYNGFSLSCNGMNNGTISLTLNGGSGQYFFEWTTADGSGLVPDQKDQTGLTAGTYDVRVWDESLCEKNWSFTLNEPDPITISDSLSQSISGSHNINCASGTDGGIYLTVSGGTGNYTYSWTTTDGSGIIPGNKDQISLAAGNYYVVIEDSNGCLATAEMTLTEPGSLLTTITAAQISCAPGFSDGAADITVNGGITPYTYNWSNGETIPDISGLSEGWYFVDVRDANNCMVQDSVWIHNPPPLEIGAEIRDYNGTNISCKGRNDGEININMESGTPVYIYQWSTVNGSGLVNGQEDQTGLTAGDYTMHVTDANNCTGDTIFHILEPDLISVDIVTSLAPDGENNINCQGDNTASIDLTISGGTPDYTVQWNDGYTGNSRSALLAGDYQAQIMDLNGCFIDTLIHIMEPDKLEITYSVKKSYCPDMSNGEINLTVSGGAPGYQYLWSDGSTWEDRNDLAAGEYTVEVSDINNCYLYDTIQVESVQSSCLEIPTGFSPNGDGRNDTWQIELIELYPDAVIEVYNRWGTMVFRSEKGYPNPWDGRMNGRILPVDSYHFVIDFGNGTPPIIGNITIVK